MKRILCLVAILTACKVENLLVAEHVGDRKVVQPDGVRAHPRPPADPPACASAGKACQVDADCCAGVFCNNVSYAAWACTAPQPNGAYCVAGSQCQSGVCTDYACGSACATARNSCATHTDCCASTFCNNFTYSPWTCVASQANGAL